MRSFADVFKCASEASAEAPGSVYLLGEHTAHCVGHVLAATIPQTAKVSVARSASRRYRFYSANLGEFLEYEDAGAPPRGFGKYIFGCIEVLRTGGVEVPPLLVHIGSDVPVGVGLSSSAALEVAALRALRALLSIDLDDVELAKLARRAEVEYAGARSGMLDQMVASIGQPSRMLLIDARTMEHELLPWPDADLIVLDSNVARTSTTSGQDERRSECERAARLLGITALRDESTLERIEQLPEPLARRARHVITENARALEAAHGVDATRLGELMNQSHASLRDDYDASVAPLDEMVRLLQEHPKVYGARLTGFGGACAALVHRGTASQVKAAVLKDYRAAGLAGKELV